MFLDISEPKLTYDDVLLVPKQSSIENREAEIDITTDFLGWKMLPIISANMDFVTGVEMANAMYMAGGLGILSRFIKFNTDDLRSIRGPVYISVGIRDLENTIYTIKHAQQFIQGVCIDVAHGDHTKVRQLIQWIAGDFPDLKIIAGNVATAEGFWRLANAGAHAVKVGIGPGSACTTRSVTGVGVPQLSAILECAEEKEVTQTLLIADGGINSSGDIVKALAAGADAVMLGHLLAGHDECPGEKDWLNGKYYKPYRGQSILGSNGQRYAPEGVSGLVEAKGPVSETIKRLAGGIRSGFSYLGARNLSELRDYAHFIRVSEGAKREAETRLIEL